MSGQLFSGWAPGRVRDGLISALGHRPIWSFRIEGCLLGEGGAVAPGAADLLQMLQRRGIRLVALGGPAHAELPAPLAAMIRHGELAFPTLLERLAAPPADVVHVGPDPRTDVAAALRAGLRAVWLSREAVPAGRGVLKVEDLAQLHGLLSGEVQTLRSGSTYHEI